MPRVGILAGSGRFPLLLAGAAKASGWDVVVFAVEDEAYNPEFSKYSETIYRLKLGQIEKLIELLHKEKINKAVMAGKVPKIKLFSDAQPDKRAIEIILKVKDQADDTLLGAVARELESEGINLLPSTFFLTALLASEGTLTNAGPTEKQWIDIRYGWRIAKEIGRLDIGQTVVVKGASVMAVEAIEGTDEVIKRGGLLAKEGAVVVKVAKPQQDTRFDMPAVGVDTIESMKSVKAAVLAIEAGWTVLLDRDQTIAKANEAGIVMVACKNPPPEEGKR